MCVFEINMNESDDTTLPKKKVLNNVYDIQKMHIEKLMKNPDKPAYIPLPRSKEQKVIHVPDFVRNVMGSSAGAGSGEFHVYRHLRRKEYARQKQIGEQGEKEQLDVAFKEKVAENRRLAEEKTARKRAKRLKQKAKRKENMLKRKREKQNKNEHIKKGNDDKNIDENISSSDDDSSESKEMLDKDEQNKPQSI